VRVRIAAAAAAAAAASEIVKNGYGAAAPAIRYDATASGECIAICRCDYLRSRSDLSPLDGFISRASTALKESALIGDSLAPAMAKAKADLSSDAR